MYEVLNEHSNDGKLRGLFKIDQFISKIHLYCSALGGGAHNVSIIKKVA